MDAGKMSDLKRIEEEHRPINPAGTDICGPCLTRPPCDVVKLARALDEGKTRFRLLAKRLLSVTAIENPEIQELISHADAAERTLREVAGETEPGRDNVLRCRYCKGYNVTGIEDGKQVCGSCGHVDARHYAYREVAREKP